MFHSTSLTGAIHIAHNFEYADATARSAASLASTDIGKIARQSDSGRFYILLNNSPLTWSEISAPSNGGGGINYIENPASEDSVVGWSTYADAAGSEPVDGIGGSPNITLTRSTSSPLRGVANFLITKDAANRQGQGVSYDFTIDRADLAKVLELSFDLEAGSGFVASSGLVGSDSDVTMFIRDLDTSTMIPVSPHVITSGVGIQSVFKGSWQANPSSTHYRAIIHIATTNASAWTFKFDNVRVGPPVISQGTPVTDLVQFTPTGSWTSNTFYQPSYWRRVGQFMECQMRLNISGGSPNATTLTFNMPSGYVIDTTKLTSPNTYDGVIGVWGGIRSAVQTYHGIVGALSSTTLGLQTDNATVYVNATNPTTWASGDSISINFRVPIVGWSSNVQMSSEADTRVVAASYVSSTSATFNSTPNIVNYETKIYDTHNAVTVGASWKFTAPVSGKYVVKAHYQANAYSSSAVGQYIALNVFKNGSADKYIGVKYSETTSNTNRDGEGSITIELKAGDYIDLRAEKNESTAVTTNTTPSVNYVQIERVSGPAAIVASDTIGFKSIFNATPNVPNTTWSQITGWPTTLFDYTDSFNETTGLFTVPAPGLYLAHGVVAFATSTAGLQIGTRIYKNGTEESTIFVPSTTVGVAHSQVTSLLQLNVGDTLSFYAYQNSGGPLALHNNLGETTSFSVHKVVK